MKKLLLFGSLFLGLSAFGQIPSYVPSNGLIGWWPFNGNANDESGNVNNGTVNGAILTTDHLGNSNSAYAFNGTSDYIELPYSTLWDFGLADFTLAGWFLSLDGGLDNIIRFDDGWNPPSLWGMRVKASKLNFLCKGAGPLYSPMTSDSITTGIWHHTVMVRSSNSLLIYLDGNLIHTEITAAIPDIQTNGTYYPSIGRLGSFDAEYFTGDLDDIGIWNRALTECEVQNLFNSQSINSVTQNGPLLTADTVGSSYQWLDCDNNYVIINGETNQSYTPAITGNYAVEVTLNGCVDTSACFLVDYTGIEELLQNEKELVKIVDFMGRETEFKPNTPLIFIYSDGKRERIMKLEE